MSITTSNFRSKLSGFVRSINTQRDNYQELLNFAFEQAVEHGQLSFLTETLQAAIDTRAIRTKSVKDYISASLTNIKWAKNKDGVYVFTKAKKGVAIEFTDNGLWYEFNNDGLKPTPDYDLLARTKTFMTNLDKVIKGEVKLKEGQTIEQAQELKQRMQSFFA